MRPIVLFCMLVLGFDGPDQTPSPASAPGAEAPATTDPEVAAQRAEVQQKLKLLPEPMDPKTNPDARIDPHASSMREVLKGRLKLLDLHESTAAQLDATENPEQTPEAEEASLRLAIERARTAIAQSLKDPKTLLPEIFAEAGATTDEKRLAEMMDAVSSTQDAVDAIKKSLDEPSPAPAGSKKVINPIAQARERRDEARQTIAILQTRADEADAALASITDADEREIATERLLNIRWESRVQNLLLRVAEARIDLETKRASLTELQVESRKLDLELQRKRLEAMRKVYRSRVEQQQFTLKKASASESARAEQTADPAEKFRALRSKELLDEQATLQERELELAATPTVSLSEQTEKAAKAAEDFQRLKTLVNGGRSTGLVAQRLNNSYRRFIPERAAIQRNELAQVLALLSRYENELTVVELDQLNETQSHLTLQDELLKALPAHRRAEAVALFEECERKQQELLEKRRRVLSDLAERADKTRQQIVKRLETLDAQYGFVRTHLFWVRDSPPLGRATIEAARDEAAALPHTLMMIVSQPWNRSYWQSASPDFLWGCLGLLVFPAILYRVRRGLRAMLDHERIGSADLEPTVSQP